MTNESHVRVANPPPKPLMIWDGECHFCKRWIERWREITAGEVDYVAYQEAADQFPEIPVEQFKRAVALIEPDGKTFFAAEAVYRSLRYRSSRKWLSHSYDRVPGFAAISELGYKFIADHRKLGSAVTRLLWGKDVRPPTYFWARRWFLRVLGLIYLIAFVSLWVQVDGLVGSDGISPVNQFLFRSFRSLRCSSFTCRLRSRAKLFSAFNGTSCCWRPAFCRSFSRRGNFGQSADGNHQSRVPRSFCSRCCFSN